MNMSVVKYANYLDGKVWELEQVEAELERIRKVKANLARREAQLLVKLKRIRQALKV